MGISAGKQWSVNLFLLLTITVSIGLIELLDRNQKSFIRDNLQTRAKEELSIVRAQLEAAIVSDIYVAHSLSTLISANPDLKFNNWDKLASGVKRKSKHIKIIGLAPDDVIQYIYPLEGNERALGLDYRTIPAQWKSIKKAQELQEIFIAGPVNLVQGGRALIARMPIFSDPPLNQRYWGVCSVVLDLDNLFVNAGVESFAYKYNLAIRGVDSTGSSGAIFYGEAKVFENAFSTQSVHFPYGSWSLAASTKSDLLDYVPWYRSEIARLIGYPTVLLLVLAFTTIFRLYSRANERSLHDELTGIPNRRYFMYTLEHQFESVAKQERDESFAILNIDLDKFKQINDQYGHAAGDKVLIACAERIKGVLRTSDVVSRIGGDEFLVLLPRISHVDDVDLINIEIQKALCHTPVIYDQHLIHIKVSVGYAMYKQQFATAEDMLKVADARMYQEKRRQLSC
ncbi:diguanylate cyclase [Vibrio sonorensis]|uniref:diguanylate cyclase n=1 Tax=Vibrio sonorensis TaxID=1004316 RepID=UPI0008DAE35F|nr:diguanylate cyclase [Vibrio sonorensis]